MSNHPDTCDSLHAINLASDVVSILQYFFRIISYLTLCIYLAAHHYGHVTATRILNLTSCHGITNLLLQKFTFSENQTFLQNFYATKIWSHTVCIVCMYINMIIYVCAHYIDQYMYYNVYTYLYTLGKIIYCNCRSTCMPNLL